MDRPRKVRALSRFNEICASCIADGIPSRSFAVALVVGSILNLINQGDAIVAGAPVNLVKIILTYLVPYGVATYGAVSLRLNAAATQKP